MLSFLRTCVRETGQAVVMVTHDRRPATLPALTGREHQLLLLVARGLSDAEIAAELLLSETTVEIRVSDLLLELGLRGREKAVVLAHERGLVTPAGT